MFYFLIPLLSKQVAKDWDKVSELFNRTLWSCYNQTSPNFHIVVVCHEIPKLRHKFDDRVEFISLTEDVAPIPRNHEEKMLDKGIKTHVGAMKIREYGAGFTMMVDGDDLVSNRIVEYVEKHSSENGFYVKKGYCYFPDNDYFETMHKFSSGSACIVKYTPDDLPSEMQEVVTANEDSNPWIIRKRHGGIVPACEEQGRPLKPLPFKAAVYVLGTGENHSLELKHTKFQTRFRELVQLFEFKHKLKGKLKKEFSVDWL